MCGIAGLLGPDAATPELIQRMADVIAHRGPDDRGVWVDADVGIALGHRRLSIVDLSPHGHQPMLSGSGRFIISYNGEIYNHADIRGELEAAGNAPEAGWRGYSDTETLVEAIAAFGLKEALGRAVGMFAFALWDRQERTLHLVRDRFGEKPLYYGRIGRDFGFASELKSLRVHPRFDAAISRQALHDYAARTYIPAPLSIYHGIFKVPPGCILSIAPDARFERFEQPPVEGTTSGPVRLTRYWSYRDVVTAGLSDPIVGEGAAIEAVNEALCTAIRGQSIADVPVGAFLSGGIDSTAVVALYQKYSATPVRTYTIGFEEAGFDEAKHARAVAAHLGTTHHEYYVSVAEARDVIPLLPAIYDEPFADSSQIPTFLVSKFARRDVTVALTGDGGDELFGGYNRHTMAPSVWAALSRLPRPLRRIAAASLGSVPSATWGRLAVLVGRGGPFIGSKIRKGLRVAAAARNFDDVFLSFLDEWSHEASPVLGANGRSTLIDLDLAGGADDASRMMYADATSYLPDDILCKVDRASMAVSLETRVPFLDHRVAAVAARIPVGMNIHGGVGKRILRSVLGRHVPAALFDRPKTGFGIPVGEWIKGPLRPWAEELLSPKRLRDAGWWDSKLIEARLREHLSGRRDSTPALWSILMFEAWRDQQH